MTPICYLFKVTYHPSKQLAYNNNKNTDDNGKNNQNGGDIDQASGNNDSVSDSLREKNVLNEDERTKIDEELKSIRNEMDKLQRLQCDLEARQAALTKKKTKIQEEKSAVGKTAKRLLEDLSKCLYMYFKDVMTTFKSKFNTKNNEEFVDFIFEKIEKGSSDSMVDVCLYTLFFLEK